MRYKAYLYIFTTLLSVFALGGINFDKIMKKNRPYEARIIVILISIIMGYLITNFIVDFINITRIG
ncbi:MAG TPA: DUF1146 family protein [Bacilli bacterium]|nr:DUF1146 family protein [Bacilli bacterium]